jgi:hypothetical protein
MPSRVCAIEFRVVMKPSRTHTRATSRQGWGLAANCKL